MGWLDNSTNNIILDAVLTDYGRQALAKNDGSFRISRFGLGDDEVDYSIISKYGRTVGREKIEKNTPVFEAFTNQNLSLKYKMISVPRPLLHLPSLSFSANVGSTTSSSAAELSSISTVSSIITLTQAAPEGQSIEPDIIETNFDVYVPDMFLRIDNVQPVGSPDVNKIAMYNIPSQPSTSNREIITRFSLSLKTISSTTFTVYGQTESSGKKIYTSIRVVGRNSGAFKDIPVTIKNYR